MPVKTIRQKVFFLASPEEIYNAFLDTKKHSAFTGAKATGAAKVGALFTAWGGYIKGKHLQLVKNKKIIQEWKTTEWPDGYPPSILEITLTAKKGGTELVMVQKNVPAEGADSYDKGWEDYYWKPLKKYFGKK